MSIHPNPLATAKEYVTTADGRILQAAGGPGKNTASMRDMGGKGPKNASLSNTNASNKINNRSSNQKPVEWAVYKSKHKAPNGMSWKKVVKSTRHGEARYKPEINIKDLELHAWKNGKSVTKIGKNWKVFKHNEIIGAKSGKETCYLRVECSANTIHGHPITETEYLELLK